MAHHEKKLIWADVSGSLPDLLVSVGTGCHLQDAKFSEAAPPSVRRKSKAGRPSLLSQMYQTGSERLGDILNCNRIWETFLAENAQLQSRSIPDGHQRYVRINPVLGETVPRLDDVSMIEDVERAVTRYFRNNSDQVKQTAHRLIASTFFFETEPTLIRAVGNEFQCQGKFYWG